MDFHQPTGIPLSPLGSQGLAGAGVVSVWQVELVRIGPLDDEGAQY